MIIPNRGSRVLIRKMNSMLVLVGQPAEEGRAEAAEAEHQPEKDPGDHPDLAGHQVGGVDQDGGECRGDDESDDDGEHDRAGQVRIGPAAG